MSTVSGAFFFLAGAGPLTTHPSIHLSHWRPTYLSLSHLIISLCSSFSLFLHLFLLLDESHFTFIFMRMVSHFFLFGNNETNLASTFQILFTHIRFFLLVGIIIKHHHPFFFSSYGGAFLFLCYFSLAFCYKFFLLLGL